jgi:hypothetical protein
MTPMIRIVVMIRAGLDKSDCSVSNVCTFYVVQMIVNYILQLAGFLSSYLKFYLQFNLKMMIRQLTSYLDDANKIGS